MTEEEQDKYFQTLISNIPDIEDYVDVPKHITTEDEFIEWIRS